MQRLTRPEQRTVLKTPLPLLGELQGGTRKTPKSTQETYIQLSRAVRPCLNEFTIPVLQGRPPLEDVFLMNREESTPPARPFVPSLTWVLACLPPQ